MKQLIIGGVRSGKSDLAERLAQASRLEVIYIATATAGDTEMTRRIERHRESRPSHWLTIEEPLALADTLREQAAPSRCLLIDCLTLWLSNCLLMEDDQVFPREREALLDGLEALPGAIIFVSNEVGSGIVPLGALSRRFADESGWLNQAVAQRCDRVVATIAGLPLILKGTPL